MIRTRPALLAALLLVLGAVGPAPGQSVSSTREAMWPAPAADDWAKPCLITWQRSYEDALAVSKETGKPILVCVNMDGEIASEHYAGVRYRQPEIAKLYEPYVCVIASVYRHTPRDHDEQGRRIPCPRFGTVTCGEHVAIEPGLFDRYFDGRRVAPRHVGIETGTGGREELYDVYYAVDTDSVFETLREAVADRPLLERLTSRDVADREAVEAAWLAGDRAQRKALLERARANPEPGHAELLRLALYGDDAELAGIAWQALAASDASSSVDLIGSALAIAERPEDREALLAALERIGESSTRARNLATVQRALDELSPTVDVDSWQRALARGGGPENPGFEPVDARPPDEDDEAREALERAEVLIRQATDASTEPRFVELLARDARDAAREAASLGVDGYRTDVVLTVASDLLGDWREARRHALDAAPLLGTGPGVFGAKQVLAHFAAARQDAIRFAWREGREWPRAWLSDADAAYQVLAALPGASDEPVAARYDLLQAIGAQVRAKQVLDAGLERFPDSWDLHARLRGRLLAERRLSGLDGLEAVYEARLAREDASPNAAWFAGYASLIAAEFHRRAANPDQALAAYDRAIAHYEQAAAANPASAESSRHYAALALAGRARLALERGAWDAAVDELLASFARSPEAASSLDGLGLSPVATARTLLARLEEAGHDAQAARVQAALDALDPVHLEPAWFDRPAPRPDGPGGGRRSGRRGRGGL